MNKWIGIAIIFSLSGCAVSPDATPDAEAKITPQEALAPRASHNTVIDEEVLYLLMAAELAGQRNQYDLALDAYIQAAKRVDDARIAERAVKIGMFLKDEKRTREALEIWMSKEPDNLPAKKFAALMAIKKSDHQAAVDNLDAVFREDPAGFEGGMLEMIKALEKEGRSQFIFDVLEDLNGLHPDQPNLLFLQAMLASILHDNQLAQQKVTQVLELQPDWNRAIIFQAQLAGRAGDMDKAREFLEKAVKQSPDDKQLRKMLLEVLVNAGAYDDAIKLYQTVLDESPDDGEALFTVALIHMQQNKLDKAEGYFEKVLDKTEWEGRASFYLGKIEQERQNPNKALVWFDRAEANGYGFEADMAAVSLLLGQKDLSQAEARVKAMDGKYPEQHLRILMMKAELYNQWGKYGEAYDVLNLALKDAPDNRDVLYTRALIAERLDKLDVVESDLLKILEKNPDDVGALNALGYTLTDRTQRYDEAEKYLLKAIQLQPDEAVIVDSYGWLQFKRGKLDLALEYLKKAYDKQRENEIAAHIAEVLWAMGREKEAREFFEPIYKKFPEDEYLLKFKQRFFPDE
ncbi:tetratricopeptide repeat protein [Methylomonas sp. SURF-2]|uniref:Tetratricopeptide repeat protein n=1 Tax=Methylomonas subterranea TaxID=2952225 RepID=A0ABT1TLC2_9GAMM|nr:tetratricopeptide repeat protein [Methylomonas sp. SURF-2]MCQ8106272.1 tetratricopeptide repeat protein [Methylomonas sp. SURF-2]